ncbi:lysophospholipid acyltransferase family protein [Pedobacter arcticus]|uniref:lysophospholipid acyltransferase family protein n=1 Tax=Pedobacter arcticus TaxID=752140 RepID=UPI00036340D1|nr:1-acyl-sn-glycerol-3-phosphate acyltransferase [Pedobacter arcticus]
MIIKEKKIPRLFFKIGWFFISWLVARRFNKLQIHPIDIAPNSSYLLLCNHFSFWDGFLAAYLVKHSINKAQRVNVINFMSVKKQMQMNPWLRYTGSFSVSPGKTSSGKSVAYASEKLNTPGNVLVLYPQGNLESCHVREIAMKDGINALIPQIKGNCQIIWSSNLLEYFEGLKPSIDFHLLDCGTNHSFNFENLTEKVNQHHRLALKKQIRFTEEKL